MTKQLCQKTRLSDKDQLVETSTGYTLVWVGKPKGERRGGDVGFAILTDLVDQLECPYSITNRIMKVCIMKVHYEGVDGISPSYPSTPQLFKSLKIPCHLSTVHFA